MRYAFFLIISESRMERELAERKGLFKLFKCCIFYNSFLVASTYISNYFVATLPYLLCIREHELHVNNLYIFIRLNFIINMNNVRIVKKAYYLEYRICFSNAC